MPNRQDTMRHCRASTGQALGQTCSITGGSAGVLVSIYGQYRRAKEAGRQFIAEG